VGEKGPEMFTPGASGQIVNNTTTSNLGGTTNNLYVTNTFENGEEMITRNMNTIWNGIMDRMNENGYRFA
jgi:hypothetical protein